MHSLQVTSLLSTLVICLTSPDVGPHHQWYMWKTRHAKKYESQELETHRRLVWEKNLKVIEEHNWEALQGLHSYTMELNHLADMTAEEVNALLNGLKEPDDLEQPDNCTFAPLPATSPPNTMDWRTRGLVTPVMNQGNCNCCWAINAAGALEGQMARMTGNLIPLSVQNLLDCTGNNCDCSGGSTHLAYEYVIKNQGIDSEKTYPYEGRQQQCRYTKQGRAGTCSLYQMIPQGDEMELQRAVANIGPLSVSINARLNTFHSYRGGIYNDALCQNNAVNHGMLLVGYGTDNGQEYWLVKNSWGQNWGENGFMRMARNKNNMCGIASYGRYPIV